MQRGRNFLMIAFALIACFAAACGDSGTEPTPLAAEKLALLTQSVAGLWSGTATLVSVTGGTGAVADAGIRACVGDAFDGSNGVNASVLVIQQDGSALSARLTSADTGLAGNYTGTKGETQLVLDANAWDNGTLHMICPTGDEATITLVGSSIVANFENIARPATLTGTLAHTFNVTLDGGPHSIEGVVTQFTFTMTRR